MPVEVELFDDLDAVEADAEGALDRETRASLFERLSWFRLVGDHTPPEGRLLVIRAREEERRAWLFLGVKDGRALAWSNWYCMRFGPVLEGAGRAEPLVAALSQGLRRAGVNRLFLAPVAEDDPLGATLARKGWLTRRSVSNTSWHLRTKGMNFKDYWAARPSKLRNTAERRARTGAIETVIHEHFVAPAWADYERVYEASWKPAEGSPTLMRKLAEQEGLAGTLRLGLAYQKGAPVAAQLWLVENGIATIHKLAYVESARRHSPGTVLSMAMFRHAIDTDRVEEIDFGIGNDAYKADWMDGSSPLYTLIAYDLLSLGGLAGFFGLIAGKLVRRLRRR